MKSFSTLTAILALLSTSLVESFDDDHRTCTDKMNDDPQFKEKCIELFCRCMDDCSGGKNPPTVGPDGVLVHNNDEYSVEDCFRNNKCSLEKELDKMIDCTTCIMERPEETFHCAEFMEEKRAAEEKKRKTAQKIEESKRKKAQEEAAKSGGEL